MQIIPASDDDIDAAIAEALASQRLCIRPERMSRGEYLFGISHHTPSTYTFVRLFDNHLFVYTHNERQWTSLYSFADSLIKQELERSTGTRFTYSPLSAVSTPCNHDDEQKSIAEAQAPEREVQANREFFFLTALAVKLNRNARGDISVLSTEDMFARATAEAVPFHQVSCVLRCYLHMGRCLTCDDMCVACCSIRIGLRKS